MIKIIDKSSTGKTSNLFLLAKENNGIIVCKHPESMIVKAHSYGLKGIDFISYDEYINSMYRQDNTRPIYIDDMSEFIKAYDKNISGYTETI